MNLEEMSFRNLVEWDREDLLRILNGEFATNVFTPAHRRSLVRMGVLTRGPNRTVPTPEAMKLLEVKQIE